jgi:hypothetical protein
LVLALVVAACDGEREGSLGPGASSAPIPGMSSAMRADLDAYCHAVMSCPIADDEWLALRHFFASGDDCVVFFWRFLQRAPYARRSFTWQQEGVLVEDAAHRARLRQELASCQIPSAKVEPGLLFGWDGTVTLGGACSSSIECKGSLVCLPVAPNACGGTCAAPPGLGEPCGPEGDCDGDAELACDFRTNTCQPAKEPGSPAALGEACDDPLIFGQRPCQAQLYCFRGPRDPEGNSGPETCQSVAKLGDPCYSSSQVCQDRGFCLPTSAGAETRVCGRLIVVADEGAECDEMAASVGAKVCDGTQGLACVNGTCQPFLDGALGAPCIRGDVLEVFACAPGLYCDTQAPTPTCQALKPAGASCAESGGWSCEGFCVRPGTAEYVCEAEACVSDTWN